MNEQLKKLIDGSEYAVVMTGAGISTGSGIPDFRSKDGLYAQKAENVSYEEMLSIDYFLENPIEFYRFYKSKMIYRNARPNAAHKAIAKLEGAPVKAVLTQNIDRLHQKAGSKNVIELHGSAYDYYCTRCGGRYDLEYIFERVDFPYCDKCGGLVRPDMVYYGEALDQDKIDAALGYAKKCDLMIVVGTSLTVYPAAGLVEFIKPTAKLVIVNRDPTPYDSRADLVIRDDIVETFRD